MSREDSIQLLCGEAETQWAEIEREYDAAMLGKTIPENLKVRIKNLFENLRSILDYLAHDIADRYCGGGSDRLYFPLLDTRPEYEAFMERCYRGLRAARPDLWDYLESIQPYPGSRWRWLRDFNQINNENKHDDFHPQVAKGIPMMGVKDPNGATVITMPVATARASAFSNNSIQYVDEHGQKKLVPFTINHDGSASGAGITTTQWTGFFCRFAERDVSVMALLERAKEQIGRNIPREIRQHL